MGRWDQAIRDAAEKAARHVEAVIRKGGSSDRPWCVYSKTGKKPGRKAGLLECAGLAGINSSFLDSLAHRRLAW